MSVTFWLLKFPLKRDLNSDFTVQVNNTPLERVIKHKSLGVQIDESLNWRPHIHTISKKISAGIAILRRVSHFIPFDTRVNMYNALVMPYFYYCGAVWGNINKGLAVKLQKLQNRAAGILTFSNYDVRLSVLLDELGWERLENVRLKQLAVTMYKIHNNLSPSYLRRIFTNTSNVHSHNLRNSELNYYVPRPRTESAKGSLHYRGSVLWNKIPSEIRKLPSLNVFKTSIHGKDFSNTPWPIVTLIIHNVSFFIFNIIVNSSSEYFSLVLNTIPRKTM